MAACGDSFTIVLDEKGGVWTFGKGSHGKLGLGTKLKQLEYISEPT